jgi:hypothetical protein
MWDEQEALRDLATWVCGPVLGRPKETPPLAMVLTSSVELAEGRVNAAAINEIQWGAHLALTAVLSHFLELEPKFELPGSGYNVDLTNDEMENLWTRTRWALELLSSRVPPSVACHPPDCVG